MSTRTVHTSSKLVHTQNLRRPFAPKKVSLDRVFAPVSTPDAGSVTGDNNAHWNRRGPTHPRFQHHAGEILPSDEALRPPWLAPVIGRYGRSPGAGRNRRERAEPPGGKRIATGPQKAQRDCQWRLPPSVRRAVPRHDASTGIRSSPAASTDLSQRPESRPALDVTDCRVPLEASPPRLQPGVFSCAANPPEPGTQLRAREAQPRHSRNGSLQGSARGHWCHPRQPSHRSAGSCEPGHRPGYTP